MVDLVIKSAFQIYFIAVWLKALYCSIVISLAVPTGGIKRILCSDWLPERARDCPLWFRAKKENFLQRTFKKVRNFWTWSEMESLKAVEDNQNKGELNDSRGFIVLQNSWLSFPFLEINK